LRQKLARVNSAILCGGCVEAPYEQEPERQDDAFKDSNPMHVKSRSLDHFTMFAIVDFSSAQFVLRLVRVAGIVARNLASPRWNMPRYAAERMRSAVNECGSGV
jgi:hypothetical protein